MISPEVRDSILEDLSASGLGGPELRKRAMQLLDGLDAYDWSGIYRLEGEELLLDEYVGAPTDHVRIPVGRGVCGTAVSENRNQVIEDVREIGNYLACSTKTRSEIVVLIRRGDRILGQIDIDGHKVGAFDSSDEALLGSIAQLLASAW